MRMAIEDIADRDVIAFVELTLEPLCGLEVNRISEDDAFRGNDKDGEVRAVLNAVEIAGYMNDGTFRCLLSSGLSAA